MSDNVNHPAHYNVGGYEVLDIIQAFVSDSGMSEMDAYETGNVIKYILRWPRKNGIEDLKKARYYLNHMISRIEAADAWAIEDKEAGIEHLRSLIERKKEEMYGKED